MLKSLLVVALLASTAAAKDTPEVAAAKKLLDAQVAAINNASTIDFAGTVDDDAYGIFPKSEGAGKERLAIEAKELADAAGKVKTDHVAIGELGDTKCAWITAELVGNKTRYRLTELVAPQQKGGSDYRVLALHISAPIDDKTSLQLATDNKLPNLVDMDGTGKPGDDFTDNPVTASRYLKLSTDGAVSVIGSAPGEYATGKAAAAKLKEFSGLDQKLVAYVHRSDANSMAAAAAAIAHVEVTYKVKGKKVVVPYRVLVITAGKTLASIHYSVATL